MNKNILLNVDEELMPFHSIRAIIFNYSRVVRAIIMYGEITGFFHVEPVKILCILLASSSRKTSVDDRPIPLRTPFPDIGSDGESSLSDIPFVRIRRVLAEESSV